MACRATSSRSTTQSRSDRPQAPFDHDRAIPSPELAKSGSQSLGHVPLFANLEADRADACLRIVPTLHASRPALVSARNRSASPARLPPSFARRPGPADRHGGGALCPRRPHVWSGEPSGVGTPLAAPAPPNRFTGVTARRRPRVPASRSRRSRGEEQEGSFTPSAGSPHRLLSRGPRRRAAR